MRKLILDLCGGTGAWSKPYRDAGYDVEVITLPAYDVTKVVFSDHAIEFLRLDMDYLDSRTVLYDDVYGILAAPPCTEFSLAKAGAPRDFESGVEVLQACLKIIWQCRIHTKLAFWALENPVGFMRQFMGRPHFTYEHWQFGDMQIKPTDIWGYFKEPAATVKIKPQGMTKRYANGRTNCNTWCNANCPDEYKGMGLNRAAIRAITPPGFANAFYKANK
ncbi:DNA cytosine methyltransferase [Clostridium sp. AF15-17LB]|nr:DNA cytosine methyltransferase [Clostridium sp. AF15-17LB]